MVTISHQMYLFLMGEGSLDGTWFGDNPCPTVAKGVFWWRSALRRYAARPTADLGEVMPAAEKLMRQAAFVATEHRYDIDLGEDGDLAAALLRARTNIQMGGNILRIDSTDLQLFVRVLSRSGG